MTEEYTVALDPADGTVLTAAEVSVRYRHRAHGSRVWLKSETKRRDVEVGSRPGEGTNVLDNRITRSEFLASAGSEGRSILDQSAMRGSRMSLGDTLSTCIA